MDAKHSVDMAPEEKVAIRETPPPKSGWAKFKAFAFRKKMLVFWTLGGVVVGIALGAGLYSVHPSKLAIEIIGANWPLTSPGCNQIPQCIPAHPADKL